MDYFVELDPPKFKNCVNCLCECDQLFNGGLCRECMIKYKNEYNEIFDRIKKYINNPQKYNALFILEERHKANEDITALNKLYNLI